MQNDGVSDAGYGISLMKSWW